MSSNNHHEILDADVRTIAIYSDGAPANERVWRVRLDNHELVVETWNDEHVWHDTIKLGRKGAVVNVKLPPMPDYSLLTREHPALELIMPLVHQARRLLEAGAGVMLPTLVHTKVAQACWPIFGMRDECPPAGAASFFGTLAVWAPALDQFVRDPDVK